MFLTQIPSPLRWIYDHQQDSIVCSSLSHLTDVTLACHNGKLYDATTMLQSRRRWSLFLFELFSMEFWNLICAFCSMSMWCDTRHCLNSHNSIPINNIANLKSFILSVAIYQSIAELDRIRECSFFSLICAIHVLYFWTSFSSSRRPQTDLSETFRHVRSVQ